MAAVLFLIHRVPFFRDGFRPDPVRAMQMAAPRGKVPGGEFFIGGGFSGRRSRPSHARPFLERSG